MLDEEELVLTEAHSKLVELSLDDENFIFRFINENDYNKKYFELLSYLTISPIPTVEEWKIQLNKVKSTPIFIFVVEDKKKSIIVGSITCFMESKFIRNLGKVSHIEDIIIHPEYRTNKLGSKLLLLAIDFSKNFGCYKVILDARDDARGFYEKFGFQKRSEGMAIYF